jgi:Predicted restriction endonuclease
MQGININRDKVVFINLTEMSKYNGKCTEEKLSGGGSYIDEHGYGYEIFNFKNDNGKCYGYTPPYGKINLSHISNQINEDSSGRYIDDVLVVFTCSRKSKGRLICGFYQHARVYGSSVKDEKDSRSFNDNSGKKLFAEYNIICDIKDAFLIEQNDRCKLLPSSRSNNGVGHGQSPVWYTDNAKRAELKNDLLDYIDTLITQPSSFADEYKYSLHDESVINVVSTNILRRSQKAREDCIRLKGCYCNICGFDFEKTYGELGKGYIEIHHITPLKDLSSSENYTGTNPLEDLIPVCPNCHSIIHRKNPPYTPDEVKDMLSSKGKI